MIADHRGAVAAIAKFLDIHDTDGLVDKVVANSTMKSMKENKKANIGLKSGGAPDLLSLSTSRDIVGALVFAKKEQEGAAHVFCSGESHLRHARFPTGFWGFLHTRETRSFSLLDVSRLTRRASHRSQPPAPGRRRRLARLLHRLTVGPLRRRLRQEDEGHRPRLQLWPGRPHVNARARKRSYLLWRRARQTQHASLRPPPRVLCSRTVRHRRGCGSRLHTEDSKARFLPDSFIPKMHCFHLSAPLFST